MLLKEEMERRLEQNPSNTAILAILLDFELGLRKGEILALSERSIKDGYIHVSEQVVEDFDTTDIDKIKSTGFHVADYTKTEDGIRDVPLTNRATWLINQVRAINKEYGLKYKDYLFVSPEGRIMYPDAIDTQILRGCKYIGIPVKTMHKIRKTYGSTLLQNGVDIQTVADMLGHADISTTIKHYIFNTKEDTEKFNEVRAALGEKVVSEEPTPKKKNKKSNILAFPKAVNM